MNTPTESSTAVKTEHEMVREFHETFGHPVNHGAPTADLPGERLRMRFALVAEEFAELTGAVFGPDARAHLEKAIEVATCWPLNPDLVEIADASADMRYVLHGLELETGIPSEAVMAAVHGSNMAKVWPDGKVHYREDGKVMKPADWTAPDIAQILRDHAHVTGTAEAA